MKTVTIGVSSAKEVQRRTTMAFRGRRQGAHISFTSEESLWKTISPKRWTLLKLMAGQGPMAIREIARRLERDVRAVHSDVHVLLNAGLIERTDDGRVQFPYEAIHVAGDHEITAAKQPFEGCGKLTRVFRILSRRSAA
jgi:predicted transcriptional regulator